MKKKGLIISTVVMVIVLIASLTTATYAWFSSTSTAVVNEIGMSATAAQGLVIGAAGKADPGQVRTDYVNGDVQWDGAKWVGNQGLNTTVTPQMEVANGDDSTSTVALAFELDKALTKKTASHTAESIADVTNGNFIKASGMSGDDTQANDETWEEAVINEDYLDLTLGIAATTDATVDQIVCTITVKANDPANVGMAAAIHFDIYTASSIGGELAQLGSTVDAYTGLETTTTGFGAGKTTTQGVYNATDGIWTFKFVVATKAEGLAVNSTTLDVAQVRIVAWIEGEDASCNTGNTGTGASIGIAFDYSTTAEADVELENGALKA